jgi:hypothetical protein
MNCFLPHVLRFFWMNDCGELPFTPVTPCFCFFWMNDCDELLFTPCFALFLNEWLRWADFYPMFCAFFEWMIAMSWFLPHVLRFFWMNDCGELPFTPVTLCFCSFWMNDCCKMPCIPVTPCFCSFWMNDCCKMLFIPITPCFGLFLNERLL